MGVCRSAAVEHVDVEGALAGLWDSKPLQAVARCTTCPPSRDRLGPLCLPYRRAPGSADRAEVLNGGLGVWAGGTAVPSSARTSPRLMMRTPLGVRWDPDGTEPVIRHEEAGGQFDLAGPVGDGVVHQP